MSLAAAMARLALDTPAAARLLAPPGTAIFGIPGWHEAGLQTARGHVTERGNRAGHHAIAMQRAAKSPARVLPAVRAASVLLAARFSDAPLDANAWAADARADAAALLDCGLLKNTPAGITITLAGIAFLERARGLAKETGAKL